MTLVNEKVEHIKFGFGVITEEKDNSICVQFQDDEIGTKGFLYPEAFGKFLKAENPTVENNVLEELRARQELVILEQERKAAELREKIEASAPVKKKQAAKSTRKKSSN